MHSFHFRRASDYTGKKVVVVGAGTSGISQPSVLLCRALTTVLSAHDICADCYHHGVGQLFDHSAASRSTKFTAFARHHDVSAQLNICGNGTEWLASPDER